MCTVTFIPQRNGVLIASNRDEQVIRSHTNPPTPRSINGTSIIFPQDGKAGGTWVGMNEFGHVMVLLNGAFERHEFGKTYRLSRGLIVLDILSRKVPAEQFQRIDLDNIEPFTLVLWCNGKLWDMRWDGVQKFIAQKDETLTHIWSSATLYSPATRARREIWFEDWLNDKDTNNISIEDLKLFHTFGGQAESEDEALVMHRGDFLKTISITLIDWKEESATLYYNDLVNNTSVSTRQIHTLLPSNEEPNQHV